MIQAAQHVVTLGSYINLKNSQFSAGPDVVSEKAVGQICKIDRDAEGLVDEQRQSENIRVIKGIKFG